MSLTEMLHCRFTISCHCLSPTVFSFSIFLACAAWRFWLGALNNKGGRGQRIHEEIGAGATWKTACTDRGAFLSWSVRQRMDHCDWFRMFTRQSNILVISHGRISRDWTKHLHKTKSKYQRSVDQSIVDLEYLMAKQGNIVLKPKQEMAIYSLLQRRDVMAILSPGFGKSMIFTVFAMAKEEMSSSKTCMLPISKKYDRQPDIGNVVAGLYSNGTYKNVWQKQSICFEKVHLNFLYYLFSRNKKL